MTIALTQVAAWLDQAKATEWDYAQVKQRFDRVNASRYGIGMEKWVPEHGRASDVMLSTMKLYLPPQARILDLGAGTGRFTKSVLETFPDCNTTLVDFSANMLDEARRQLSAYAERCIFVEADMFESRLDCADKLFDCVVSVFAVCHARGVEKYRDLYRHIHRWLKPGGVFICYDHVLGGTDAFTVVNNAGWANFMAANLPDDQIEDAVVSTSQEDSPLALQQHLKLLLDVGFLSADVLWKRDIFGIYGGVK